MAKQNSKGKNTPKKGKNPANQKKKTKGRVNRYIAIRSAVSKYCREQYNKPCPEKEMNRIYWELKDRYDDVPVGKVLAEMDVLIGQKDRDELPAEMVFVQWYNMGNLLFRADGLFFKSDDDIELDLSAMGMDTFKGKYAEMSEIYRNDIYPTLRIRTYEAEDNDGWSASPQPTFIFNEELSDVKNRKFVWTMEQTYITQEEMDNYEWRDGDGSAPKRIPQKGIKSDEVRLAELRKEINAQRESALNRIDKMLEMGVINNKEYKAYYDDIMKKYNRGGVV